MSSINVFAGGRGSSRVVYECSVIAYKACKSGFPFTVCLWARNETQKVWCEQRKELMYTILGEMFESDATDIRNKIIINVKTTEELKYDSTS